MARPTTELHPLLAPLAFLIGDWVGEGSGLFSDGFAFEDALTFEADERPVIGFQEWTRSFDGTPSHSECGYIIAKEDGVVHMTVAGPAGITETLTGHIENGRASLRSVGVGHAPGSKNVTATARRLYSEGDDLVTEVYISLDDDPPSPHTRSVLHRPGTAGSGA
jgi:hypothetical protein